MKIAIGIGHSRHGDKGATSAGGVSEWNYNVPIGEHLKRLLELCGVEVLLLTEYAGGSYGAAMTWAADEIDRFGADAAIELHFNAANGSAEGFEYLFWGTSSASKRLAGLVRDAHVRSLGGRDRGIKPKGPGDRGAGFLSKPACPSIIAEPFFGDHPDEWRRFASESAQGALAEVYADGILAFLGIEAEEVPAEPAPVMPEPGVPAVDQAAILAACDAIDWQLAKIRKECGA